MINPAFEDGSIADEAAGSDDRVESGDVVDESGSGSGDGSTVESGSDEIGSESKETEDSESVDEASSSESVDTSDSSSESVDASSESDASDTTDSGMETNDAESTDTDSMTCMELVGNDACETCKIQACCHDNNYECFDPNAEDCDCVINCLSIGGLLNLCGLQCGGVLDLLLTVADTTFDCILQECGQVCP
jgi:hypothetical protein